MREPNRQPVNLRDLLDATIDVLGAMTLVAVLILCTIAASNMIHNCSVMP